MLLSTHTAFQLCMFEMLLSIEFAAFQHRINIRIHCFSAVKQVQTKRCLQHLAAKAGASCGLHLDSASAVDKQSQFAEKQTYKMFMLKSTHEC